LLERLFKRDAKPVHDAITFAICAAFSA